MKHGATQRAVAGFTDVVRHLALLFTPICVCTDCALTPCVFPLLWRWRNLTGEVPSGEAHGVMRTTGCVVLLQELSHEVVPVLFVRDDLACGSAVDDEAIQNSSIK